MEKRRIFIVIKIALMIAAGSYAINSANYFYLGKAGEGLVAASFASLYALNSLSDLERIWDKRHIGLRTLAIMESQKKHFPFCFAGLLTSITFLAGVYLQL
jgi:hypothetical protein